MRLRQFGVLVVTCAVLAVAAPIAVAFQQPEDTAQKQPAAAAPAATTPASSPASVTAASASTAPDTAINTANPNAPTSNSPATSSGHGDSKKVIHVSREYIKKLANYGFYPKNDKGQMVFCKKGAQLGSRFVKERCMDGDQVAMMLDRNQAQRDQFRIDQIAGPPPPGTKQ
jgi:pyruvate/2-oxoglutarate dehydrogenase complex dihydrolipoamide acyltransferase (E2) component